MEEPSNGQDDGDAAPSFDQPDGPSFNGLDAPEAAVVCPTCSTPLALSELPPNGLVECPQCGAQFFANMDPADAEAEARAEADAEADRERRETELSALHMRQVSTLRRSLIRTRSYLVIGTWMCAAAILQLAWNLLGAVPDILSARAAGLHVGILAYAFSIAAAAGIIVCALGFRYFLRRATRIKRELQETRMKDPETPPDFSTLGDGLEQWRALEQMHEQRPRDDQGS